jgi:hypothetical protein
MLRVEPSWIVCERSDRWAAAIRAAFLRTPGSKIPPRLYEIRNLNELKAAWNDHPHSITFVEVGPDNLPQVVDLLSGASCRCESRIVALVDYSLWKDAESTFGKSDNGIGRIADMLREAGATDVLESPRRLQGLLQLRERLISPYTASPAMDHSSIHEWAHSLLPWQDA